MTRISKELRAMRERIRRSKEPNVSIVEPKQTFDKVEIVGTAPRDNRNVTIVEPDGKPLRRNPDVTKRKPITFSYDTPTPTTSGTTPERTERTALINVDREKEQLSQGLDTLLKGYTAKSDDSALRVAGGVAQEIPKQTLSFVTNVGIGEAEAVKSILQYADRFGIGGDATKNIVDSLNTYSQKAKPTTNDANTVLDTLGSALGSQAFYFLPGLGISKLSKLSKLKSLVGFSELAGVGASSLLESAGEAGAVYGDEKERWGEEIAKGKADFTFSANLMFNLITNKLGGMFNVSKAKSALGESIKIMEGAAGEFTQEGIQQFISNIATDRPMTEGALESAIYGAILGGMGGGGNISQSAKISDFISKEGMDVLGSIAKNEKGSIDLGAIQKDITDKITKKAPVIKERVKQENRAIRTENKHLDIISVAQRKTELAKLKERIKTRDSSSTLRGKIQAVTNKFNDKLDKIDRAVSLGRLKDNMLSREVASIKKEFRAEAMNLELRDRGKLLAKLDSVKSRSELSDAVSYMNKLGEATTIRSLNTRINNEIKTTKTTGSKPKGKFTPETQKQLDIIRGALKNTPAQAADKLISNLALERQDKSEDIALENAVLQTISSGVSDKAELLRTIKTLKEKGSQEAALKKGNTKTETEMNTDYTIDQMTGNKGIEEGRAQGTPEAETIKKQIAKYRRGIGSKFILDWRGMLQALDKTVGNNLAKMFSIVKQESMYKNLIGGYYQAQKEAVAKIYGVKENNNSILKVVQKIATEKVTIDGREMTRDQAIKWYMVAKDPTLEKSLRVGNGFTDQFYTDLNEKLSSQDKAYGDWMMDLYSQLYNSINEVFEKLNGLSLPRNEFYSPISRVGAQEKPGHIDFLEEIKYRMAVSSSAHHSRKGSSLPIKQVGAMTTMDKHFMDMSYYISFAEKIREIDSVFYNPKVKMAMEQEMPQAFNKEFFTILEKLAVGRDRHADGIATLDALRKNYVVGNLALKPILTVKQLVSTLAYIEKTGHIDLAVGIMDFLKNPVRNYNTLQKESAFIKYRGSNLERDMKEKMSTDAVGRYKKSQSLTNLLLLNVKVGDKSAIVLGTWAMRKKRLAEGNMSMEDIISEYEEFGSDTQQSSDISRLSNVQTGGSIYKLFTIFKSSTRAYFQKEVGAVNSLFKEGGLTKNNLKEVAKIMYIYHFMLPTLFQFVVNMGGWSEEDREEYKRAMILGNFNGVAIVGDAVTSLVRAAMGMKVWDTETFVGDVVGEVTELVTKLSDDDISTADFDRITKLGLSAGTSISGLPLEYANNVTNQIQSGSVKRGVAGVVGYGDWVIKKNMPAPMTIEEKIKNGGKNKELSDIQKRINSVRK